MGSALIEAKDTKAKETEIKITKTLKKTIRSASD